jgi:glycosyltransferase involved in cell wall biosynthesis
MNHPFVSIIVPCYNQSHFLDEALQSVLDQTYKNWECIIINDGSPDNAEAVAQKWCQKDNRFNYVFQENGGLCSARNLGILKAIGEFILPLDADDKIAPIYVEKAMEAFEHDDSLKVVYCKGEKFGEETGNWDLPSFSRSILARQNLIFCSAFFKKRDWELVGGYDVRMVYGLEDWEFWIAILKNGGEVKRLDEVGFFYRVKQNSMVRNLSKENREELINYLNIKHADFFVGELGSFFQLINILDQNKNEYEANLKNKKFVIDLFCVTFFGFSIFGLYNIKN